MNTPFPGLILSVLLFVWVVPPLSGQVDFGEAPINYYHSVPRNVVSRLQKAIDSGQVRLAYDAKTGYLRSLLDELQVPINSQGLVFSKTSLQLRYISPRSPRAIYFNDDVYVGYVVGGEVLEIAAADPFLGAVFYTLEQTEASDPRIIRQTHQCTQCHAGSMTQGVPGVTIRSVFSRGDGRAVLKHGSFISDHSSDLRQRWGGWYVTGTHGRERHLGNNSIRAYETPESMDLDRGANVKSLGGRIASSNYLSPHSDIVALMVLEHQTQMHNAITKARFQAIRAKHEAQIINEMLEEPLDHESPSIKRRLDHAAERVVRRLLFVNEYRLKDDIKGTSNFAEDFESLGPHDKSGRSLRQFDLKSRLFENPCSYLIYGDAFGGLPKTIKQRVYRRIVEICQNPENGQDYAHLSSTDRRTILEILRDTKPDLPEEWF